MKQCLSLLLSLIFGACAIAPAIAQDGFSGTYQPPPPQQWQPLAPQQGYGQVGQQAPPYSPPQYQPPPQYQQPPQGYPPQQQSAPGMAGYGYQPPPQGQPGQAPTIYGYANQQGYQAPNQPAPPQFANGQGGYYPQQPPQPPQNLNQQAQAYFDQTDQQAANEGQEEEQPKGNSAAMSTIKTVGKLAAGVGVGLATGYMLNKAAQRNPMLMYQQQMQNQGYGNPYGGYGGGYGGGYPMAPGMGMGGMPMMPGMNGGSGGALNGLMQMMGR